MFRKSIRLIVGLTLLAYFATPTMQADPLCPVSTIRPAPGMGPQGSLQITNSQTPYDASQSAFPGFSPDWITLHRIGSNISQHHITNTASFKLKNVGTAPITVNKITNSLPDWFKLTGAGAPFTLNAGQSQDIKVELIATNAGKALKVGTLSIQSTDTVNPVQNLSMSGIFMAAPEGGHEPVAQALINAFGWNTQVGFGYNDYEKTGVELGNHSILGEALFSRYWAPADLTKPVWAKAFVTLKHCCNSPTNFYLKGTNKVKYCTINTDHLGGQTILPRSEANLDVFAESTCQVPLNVTFGINIAYEYNTIGNPMDFIAIHPYPVRDRNGRLLPNTYMFTMDYTLRTGCGNNSGQANCDNNDNMFIVTNIKPVDIPDQDLSIAVPLPVGFNFDSFPSSGLKDSTGNFIGFNNYILNERDTTANPGPNSYKSENIAMDTAAGQLVVKTLPGTNIGLAPNNMPNLLVMRVDSDKSFMVTSRFLGGLKDTTNVAVWLGSDRDNFVEFRLKGTTLTFSSEFKGKVVVVETLTLPAALTATNSIALVLQTDPAALTVSAGYHLFTNGVAGALVSTTKKAVIPQDSFGRLFGYAAGAGMYAAHDENGGSEDTVRFESFSVVNCDGSTTPFTSGTGDIPETSTSDAGSSTDVENTDNTIIVTDTGISEDTNVSSTDDGGSDGTNFTKTDSNTDGNNTSDGNNNTSSDDQQPLPTEQEGSAAKVSPLLAALFTVAAAGYLAL